LFRLDFLPACGRLAGFLKGRIFDTMNPSALRCKCLHCKKFFVPDYRNRGRQKYCSVPECQAASKQGSQRRWLSKPDNRDYFRGPENVRRVQEWRAEHPGYWKQPPRKPRRALQEICSAQAAVSEEVAPKQAPQDSQPALQELCLVKTPLLVGLIAQFTDTALQEDIVTYTRRLIAKGQDILDQPSRRLAKGKLDYDAKENPAPRTPATGAGAVQLD
jgi:hypothetical protein